MTQEQETILVIKGAISELPAAQAEACMIARVGRCPRTGKITMTKRKTPYFTISRRQWRKMPPKTKRALAEIVKCLLKAIDKGELPKKP